MGQTPEIKDTLSAVGVKAQLGYLWLATLQQLSPADQGELEGLLSGWTLQTLADCPGKELAQILVGLIMEMLPKLADTFPDANWPWNDHKSSQGGWMGGIQPSTN